MTVALAVATAVLGLTCAWLVLAVVGLSRVIAVETPPPVGHVGWALAHLGPGDALPGWLAALTPTGTSLLVVARFSATQAMLAMATCRLLSDRFGVPYALVSPPAAPDRAADLETLFGPFDHHVADEEALTGLALQVPVAVLAVRAGHVAEAISGHMGFELSQDYLVPYLAKDVRVP